MVGYTAREHVVSKIHNPTIYGTTPRVLVAVKTDPWPETATASPNSLGGRHPRALHLWFLPHSLLLPAAVAPTPASPSSAVLSSSQVEVPVVQCSRRLAPYAGGEEVISLCCKLTHSGIETVSADAAESPSGSFASEQVVVGVLSDGRLCLWPANDDEEAAVTPVTVSDTKDERVAPVETCAHIKHTCAFIFTYEPMHRISDIF